MEAINFIKQDKALYSPKAIPSLVEVPKMRFLAVDGKGDPGDTEYQQGVAALYGLAWTIKMSKKSEKIPAGYQDFTPPPLEGLWDCAAEGFDLAARGEWKWTSLLRVPEFVTEDVLQWAKEEMLRKKKLDASPVRLWDFTEGLCVQVMHHGPYTTEQETIDTITAFIAANNLVDNTGGEGRHHEIYLGDPRKTQPENLKTILRHPVLAK